MNQNKLTKNKSLFQLADKLVTSTKDIMRTARSEEDLKIGFEKDLDPILKTIGIETNPKYEHYGKKGSTYRGRPDAVHGHVIIEYENPNSFSSKKILQHAFDQLVGYIKGAIKEERVNQLKLLYKILGVGFDGNFIFFVKYKGREYEDLDKIKGKDFAVQGPYSFDIESAQTLLKNLRSLSRLPLSPERLTDKFGPQSKIAPQAVSAFANALKYWDDNPRVRVFYEEWKRLFGIVYGEQFAKHQQKEAEVLLKLYKVSKDTDFQELLFSVHTYFALLMKLIAAELLLLRETDYGTSFSSSLTHSSRDELYDQLKNIEEGGIYAKRGITNFLEGDFFRWYLDAWSSIELEEIIREMTKTLSEFEPSTTDISPESTRDLLKKLYQYLVPQQVRHKLGEYYTPDWLAELLLNETGYDGNTLKKFLDPACGSGTFLVLAIQRAREFGKKNNEPPLETAKRITENIWGFDLNPLAVIASRTNYIFALGDLIYQLPSLEIKVYLADSILWPESGLGKLNFAGGENLKIQTSVGEFHVPNIWIKNQGLLMTQAANLTERMIKDGFEASVALNHYKNEGLAFTPHEKVVENFYNEIMKLEKEGKNGIWARFLKNAFAPVTADKFDFVIGNPPWIRWGYLSEEYRKATEPLWHSYGLFSLKGHAARLGGGEKDFSMLFTYASADYYLKKNAKLGFLITQEVFKSKGGGEGFRSFRLRDHGEELKILKALDLVQVKPFEGAANKTSAIILKKGHKTTYPVPYILWNRKKRIGRIHTDASLNEALSQLNKKKLTAQPIGKSIGSWQTIPEKYNELSKLKGKNEYQAHQGADPQPYGVYILELIQVLSDGNLLVRNQSKRGKQKVQLLEEIIEKNFVYPGISGADIKRWNAIPSFILLTVQDPVKREPYPQSLMKSQCPRTYSYLLNFKKILLSRGSKSIKELAERTEFYAMYGIGDYTVSPFKVVWKFMSNDITAAVISNWKTLFGYKKIIPIKTVAHFSANNENEAHYLCSIINSTPVREFIKSYSSAGRGFGSPSVMKHVGIPKFDSSVKLHKKLSQSSKNLHRLKSKNKIEDITELEKENDELVKQLFSLKN